MKLLEFIPATRKVLRQLSTEPEEFAAEYEVVLHEVAQSVAEAGLKFMKTFPYETPPEWFGYLAIEGETQRLCGVCTFKGPEVEGAVEMAYFTFPGFEGRGIGTYSAKLFGEPSRAHASDARSRSRSLSGRCSTRSIKGRRFSPVTGPCGGS